ncbi:MAG: formate dehydrogenase subunit gamma [Paracoccus sp. (in: a-proteobacteria)]|nr:formate dehydrogenase subunit gamma [Paracoccus sp. (in: a-proteobacteria)]
MAEGQPVPASDEIEAIIDPLLALEGPLLPMLHALMDAFGHIPQAAYKVLAARLNLSRAEIHGVVSFYHDFRTEPAGRHVLKLCRAEACQSMGGEAVAADLLARLGMGWHETSPDARITIEPVYCLGLCACAPAAMLDDTVHGRVSAESLSKLVAGVRG